MYPLGKVRVKGSSKSSARKERSKSGQILDCWNRHDTRVPSTFWVKRGVNRIFEDGVKEREIERRRAVSTGKEAVLVEGAEWASGWAGVSYERRDFQS